MTCKGEEVTFGVARGQAIKETDGTMLNRGDCRCPICKQVTEVEDLRRAGLEGKLGERMVTVITDTPQGKSYRPVEPTDLKAFEDALRLAEEVERPGERNADANEAGLRVHNYGFKTFGSLFNARQLLSLQCFLDIMGTDIAQTTSGGSEGEHRRAVAAYLGLWISRIASFQSTFGRWRTTVEAVASPFGMQAIPIVWDYPEMNPLSDISGGESQLEWIVKCIKHESSGACQSLRPGIVLNLDGARLENLSDGFVDVVATDPPYFDAIAYADLSDFFYIWLKRSLGRWFPQPFATPLTAKGEEATALRHRHGGSTDKAKDHFTSKLAECLREARRACRPNGVLTVMFAHQSTEAWTALINALFEAGLSVEASYPIDTERGGRMVALDSSALASSISVVCRRRVVGSTASLREVRRKIEDVIARDAHDFFDIYGYRGSDLIVACYGPALGVFARHERVERADGTPVSIPELLKLARESALKAIAGEFMGDALSRLYFVWANLYGTGEQAWDDARIVVQVGSEGEDAMEVAQKRCLFVVDGARCRLALLKDRADRRHLGEEESAPLIDQLHHAMRLWQEERRADLVGFLRERGLTDHAPFWKLAQALFEVLPRGEEDWKLVSALLAERDTLRIETGRREPPALGPLFNGHEKA